MIKRKMKHCRTCGRHTEHAHNQGANHILHLLASVFLCGLWIPFWIYFGLNGLLGRYRCGSCGR